MKKFFLCSILTLAVFAAAGAWEEAYNLSTAASAASRRGDWVQAARNQAKAAEAETLDVNKAASYVYLAMYLCNCGDYSTAKTALRNAIYIMKNGDRLGNGCERNTETFLEFLNQGKRIRFTHNDIHHANSIGLKMTTPAYNQFSNKINQEKIRHQHFINIMQHQINRERSRF